MTGRNMTGTGTRIGVDLQDVGVVAQAIAEFGASYLDRCYTAAEQRQACLGGADPADSADSADSAISGVGVRAEVLATLFAAKEAVLKVLGRPDGIALTCLEVLPSGAEATPDSPTRQAGVRLSGLAALRAAELGLGPVAVSLTESAGLASAVAVARPVRLHRAVPTQTTPAGAGR